MASEPRLTFGLRPAAFAGAVTGALLYGLISGLAGFNASLATALAELSLHAGIGAVAFAGGALLRNQLIA